MTLRPDVRFHDGRLLTSADVVFTFRSFLDPAFTSGRKGAYRMVQAVDAVDPPTVRFTLKEPFASFPINLVMGIVPAGATDLAGRPVGSGPYVFERLLRASTTPDRATQRALYTTRSSGSRPRADDRLWHKTNVVIAQPDIRPGVLTPIADLSFLRTTRRVTTAAAVPLSARA